MRSPRSERDRARETQRRLLRESRSARLPLALTVALGLVTVGLIIAQAALLAKVIAGVFIGGQGLAEVGRELIWLAAISIARGLADAGFEATGRIGAARVMSELRLRLARHLLGRGGAAAALQSRRADGDDETIRSGELVAAAIDGVDSLEAWFARYLPQVVLSVLAPIAILGWVVPLDWPAALILLITAPLIPIFMILIGLATEHRSRRRWRLLARLSSHFLDRVSGLETLRVNGLAESQTEAIARAGDSYRRQTMATLRIGFLSALVLELLAMLGTAVVAATVGIQLAGGHLELSAGLCVLLLAPELYMPLRRLGSEFHAGADGMAAAERIFKALDTTSEARSNPGREEVSGVASGPIAGGTEERLSNDRPLLKLRGVHFAYEGRDGVLRGVDLTLESGERVGIVGPSGSGKSTLVALILGLLSPQRGTVEIDSIPLDPTDPESLAAWHRQIAWIPQRPILIGGTVADNVRLMAPDAAESAVREAVSLAGLDSVLEELPEGLATVIGEGGRRLSAGQRQRIALARAFLRDAPVVLLDEPTAHLDRETATGVASAIERLTEGRSALIISHRPEPIAGVDRVLELDGGLLFPALVETRRSVGDNETSRNETRGGEAPGDATPDAGALGTARLESMAVTR